VYITRANDLTLKVIKPSFYAIVL